MVRDSGGAPCRNRIPDNLRQTHRIPLLQSQYIADFVTVLSRFWGDRFHPARIRVSLRRSGWH
jgi:hypothetical protein